MDPGPSPPEQAPRAGGPSGVVRPLVALAVVAIGLGTTLYGVLGPVLESGLAGVFFLFGVIAAFLVAYPVGLHRDRRFLALWVGVSVALAVVSVLTGRLNGLTGEPYATPAFVRLLPNLYGQTLHLAYTQYGTPLTISSAYVYLPLLTVLQVPGLDYRWVAVGAWAATVYLLRRSGAAVVLLGSPFVALIAANGFNDLVPFLALTLSVVTLAGPRARAAEVVALGLKQFANVLLVAFHLWHRRWGRALLAVGVSALFLLPFAFFSPSGVVCHAILLDPSSGCSLAGSGSFVSGGLGHLNYFAWVLYVLAVFGTPYVAELRGPGYARERAELAHWGSARRLAAPGPFREWMVPLLPFVRLRHRLAFRSHPAP